MQPKDLPDANQIHRLMNDAAAHFNRGDMAGAESRCHAVLARAKDYPQALHLLGLCRWEHGDLTAAVDILGQAARLRPDDAQLLHDLGGVHTNRGEWHAAARAYVRAVDLRPDYALSYLNLGVAFENLGDSEQAERGYRRALECDPQLAAAAASLAALCEKDNRLDEAEKFVQTALSLNAMDPVANLTRAQLDFRAGGHREAVNRLEAQLQRPLSPRNRSLTASRLGAAYDKLGEYDAAFAAFITAKEALKTGNSIEGGVGFYAVGSISRIRQHLETLIGEPAVSAAAQVQSPVFIVGFPRSGTTLIDQILSSHPRLLVLEEKESLYDALNDFLLPDAGLDRLATLGTAALEDYRRKYWQRVDKFMPDRNNSHVFVDKLPLNTIFMPIIARLFPGARFIFAVRDPRDVVLSCFMQAFGLNEAMRHFLSLADTARYYAAVMDIGINSMQRLQRSVQLLRYETLVDDLENEARRLCGFLGLEWESGMLRFQDTARKRRINTPSYHQVVQPVYQSARARWRNYERHLSPVLEQLLPYVEYFDYGS